jgi:hypothetical protein
LLNSSPPLSVSRIREAPSRALLRTSQDSDRIATPIMMNRAARPRPGTRRATSTTVETTASIGPREPLPTRK